MCEWLAYNEWCDVKLLCGGRSFNAHRAVLASVSTFLRQILLSCQADESPTFIVLPDFDFEAMSSVLYYIYNGEVVVQRQKLDMFLDIIRAMQIFIDYQYLGPKLQINNSNFHLNIAKSDVVKNEDTFTLGIDDYSEHKYFKIKKGMEVRENLQYSQSNSDPPDKQLRCRTRSGLGNSSLGNLKSPYVDRQKNSFLRDLFIETYPRNGNVNGQTAGVLAISNESYRAPASQLLTNANDGHLSAGDTLLETHKNTTGLFHSPMVSHPGKQLQCSEQIFKQIQAKTVHDSPCVNVRSNRIADLKSFYKSREIKKYTHNSMMNNISAQTNLSFLSMGLREHNVISGVSTLDLSITQAISDSLKSTVNIQNNPLSCSKSMFTNLNDYTGKIKGLSEGDTSIIPKATIHNHVLESPWCPRVPNNFKPFRRKTQDLDYNRLHNKKDIKEDVISDSNNNIDRTELPIIIEDLAVPDDAKETDSLCEITIMKDDLKCVICNQVFTSSQTLSDHMRRHSANARYCCGECGKTFSQLRNFKYHMSIHRGTREFAATCTVCGKYFNDRGYLSSHMKIHRNRKEYKCAMCPKSFNQRVAYNMHVRIHTGVKPHVCDECGKAFSRKMLLKQHQRTHSGERPYACPHCDKRFADRSNMTLHLRLHTGVKPFSCSLCPKSFTKKHHLKSHLNFHTGSKPYSCPRCNLAFTQSSNMRTHLKKCNAPDPVETTTVVGS